MVASLEQKGKFSYWQEITVEDNDVVDGSLFHVRLKKTTLSALHLNPHHDSFKDKGVYKSKSFVSSSENTIKMCRGMGSRIAKDLSKEISDP